MESCARKRGVGAVAVTWMLVGCAFLDEPTDSDDDLVPFERAVPDVTELLTTDDVGALRQRLARAELPTSGAHHEVLRDALQRVSPRSLEHLFLLTEAVSGESSVDGKDADRLTAVVDELLTAGWGRVPALDAGGAGRLLGRLRTDEGLQHLAPVLSAAFDDGSPARMRALLRGFERDARRAEFVRGCLARNAEWGANRRVVVLESMDQDSARADVARAFFRPVDPVTVDDLAPALATLGFDDARLDVLEDVLPRLSVDDGHEALVLLRVFSTDPDRQTALRLLLSGPFGGREDALDADVIPGILAAFSFDGTRRRVCDNLLECTRVEESADLLALLAGFRTEPARVEMLEALFAARPDFEVSASALLGTLDLFPTSARKVEVLALVRPKLVAPLTGEEAARLLTAFALEEVRLRVLRDFADEWSSFDVQARRRLQERFTVPADRERAGRVLDLQ